MAAFRRGTMRDLRSPAAKMRARLTIAAYAVLLALCVTGFTLFGVEKARYNDVRTSLRQMVQAHLDQAMYAYDGIDLRSANVRGDILPTMEERFHYAQALDNAVVLIFGSKYEMLNNGTYDDFESAMAEYARADSTGQSSDAAREMLDECVTELKGDMDTQLDARGNLVKIP